LALTGCSGQGGPVRQSTASSSSTATQTTVAGSIPTLQFIAASSVPGGDALKAGSVLPASSAKPLQTGEHINSVSWVEGSANGQKQLSLDLGFDSAGTAELKTWSKAAIGQHVLVVLNGTVLANPKVVMSLPGSISLSGPVVLAARPQIDVAVVPGK
jgi:preprotein translocase subunit SecD